MKAASPSNGTRKGNRQRHSRKLRLFVRNDEYHSEFGTGGVAPNLFVRLPHGVARDLLSLAALQNQQCSDIESCWSVALDGHVDPLNFLPLKISWGDDNLIFASYNGGSVSCDNNAAIEIPRPLLSECESKSRSLPEFVLVEALKSVEYATRVLVEPLSTEDWELLEIHGGTVEQGGFLSQVSVVYEKQILCIHLGDTGDQVRVLVKEIVGASPRPSSTSPSSVWPVARQSIEDGGQNTPRCVLLVQDTEVVVSPKPRPTKKTIPWSCPLRLIPSEMDWGDALGMLSKIAGGETFAVGPGCILVHPDEWTHESEWARIKPDVSHYSKNYQERVVRVTVSRVVPRKCAVLYCPNRIDMRLTEFLDSVRLKPFTPKRVASESISIVPIDLVDHPTNLLPVWNIPDIALSSLGESPATKVQCYQEGSNVVLPVGAIVPASVFGCDEHRHPPGHWFRLSAVKGANSRGCVVVFDRKGIENVWRSYPVPGGKSPNIATLSSVTLSIRGPRDNVVSLDWVTPVLDKISYFPSSLAILYGTTGSGKSHSAILLSTLASFRLRRPILYLNCRKLQKSSPKMAGILGELDSVFRRAEEAENAMIVLDDLDSLTPNLLSDGENNASARMHAANPMALDQSKLISDRLLHLLESGSSRVSRNGDEKGITMIATCSAPDSLNAVLLQSAVIPMIETNVPALSAEDRVALLKIMIQRHQPAASLDLDSSDLSQQTESFLPRDLEKLSLRVSRSHQAKPVNVAVHESLVEELSSFTPLAQMLASKSEGGNLTAWSDVGGLFDVKAVLESIVRHPVLYRRIYNKAQIRLPRGIMLYGPPGCGKSILPPAIARECNYPIVTVKGPEILDKYIGQSEAKIRELFHRASQMAPSILFLDELEALSPRRGSDSTGVTDRVVNQLLTFLDGVEDASSGTVYIIGSTSRPDKVDPAILRPGRLERHLFVGPPECEQEWADLIVKIARQWNLAPECLSASTRGEKEIVQIVSAIPRLSPADLRAAFDTAHLHAVHRLLSVMPAHEIEKVEVYMEDLKFGLQETRPSLNETEAGLLESLYKPFRGRSAGFASTNTGAGADEIPHLRTSLR